MSPETEALRAQLERHQRLLRRFVAHLPLCDTCGLAAAWTTVERGHFCDSCRPAAADLVPRHGELAIVLREIGLPPESGVLIGRPLPGYKTMLIGKDP